MNLIKGKVVMISVGLTDSSFDLLLLTYFALTVTRLPVSMTFGFYSISVCTGWSGNRRCIITTSLMKEHTNNLLKYCVIVSSSVSGETRDPSHAGPGSGQEHLPWRVLVHGFFLEAAAQQALHAPGGQLRWVPSCCLYFHKQTRGTGDTLSRGTDV